MIDRTQAAARASLRQVIGLSGLAAALHGIAAYGLTYDFPLLGDPVKTVLNSTITMGAGLRMQAQSANLIGKANLNPNVCGIVNTGASTPPIQYMSCQTTLKDQTFAATHLVQSPGAATANTDDGDLNYDKGGFFSGVLKVTEDFKADYDGYGVFGRMLYFHDFVNSNFAQYHPDRITPDNYKTVGFPAATTYLPVTYLDVFGVPVRNFIGQNPLAYPGRRIYGPGGVVYDTRSDGETQREIGSALQWLDSYAYGVLPLWDNRELSFRVGRHTLNWGESTTLVNNSINSINPVDANNFYRIGSQVEEDFIPVNMVSVNFQPDDNTTIEAFYQLEWQPTEIPAAGSYFSSLDIGSKNAVDNLNIGFGGVAEDPSGIGRLLYNPLAQLGASASTMYRLPDVEARSSDQFGIKLGHYFEDFINGTDVAFYYEHYNSRLPLLSFYATNPSCARAAGAYWGQDSTHFFGNRDDHSALIQNCPNIPFVLPTALQLFADRGSGSNPIGGGATDHEPQYGSVAPLDTVKFQLEYPNNIQLFGTSFNTTLGSWSIQGEVAYRPHQPLQIDAQDLVFAANGPTLINCVQNTNCSGSPLLSRSQYADFSFDGNGNTVGYGSSDISPNVHDTINIGQVSELGGLLNIYGAGVLPSSSRAFPSFVIPYRGGKIGQNPACPYGMTAAQYSPSNPCWIQGWINLQTYELNLGATRVFGMTENWFKADQIELVGELGAMYVPNLPPLNQLQLEAFGTNFAASAGADGSGSDGSRQACSVSPDCVSGVDGLRFNPHQQDLTGYPDKLSWGYRVISIFKYESVLPGISLRPSVYYSQDVMGTSPGPGGNFVAGSKIASLNLETRYKSALTFTTGYTWLWGGGQYNPLSDRDFLQFFVTYQF